MSLNAKKAPMSGGNRVEQPVLDPGAYPARTVQIIDLGVQAQRPYQGQEKPPAHMIMLGYELLDSFMVDKDGNELEDKPRWLSEEFSFNNLEKDLATSTKRYKALDPAMNFDGDFTQLIDIPCTVTLGHNKSAKNGKTYEKILSVASMRPRDAANAPALKNPTKVFMLDEPDMDVFNAIPAWIQDKIKANLNYQGSPLQRKLEGGNAPAKGKAQKAPVEAQDAPQEDGEW